MRRKRLDTNGTIHYVGRYERNVGNGIDTSEKITKYYYASFGKVQRLVAFRRNGVLYWVGTDHLGSTIRVANSSFVAVDQMRYKAYGESRDAGASLGTDRKYTGQTEDAIVGLYWYASRAYDPVIGRFTAADTIVPDPGNPQALNRYAYAVNNPLKYVDPTGHSIEDWFDESWVAEFREAHGGADPTEGDFQYRFETMAVASGMAGSRAEAHAISASVPLPEPMTVQSPMVWGDRDYSSKSSGSRGLFFVLE